jgi:hypothetical protein
VSQSLGSSTRFTPSGRPSQTPPAIRSSWGLKTQAGRDRDTKGTADYWLEGGVEARKKGAENGFLQEVARFIELLGEVAPETGMERDCAVEATFDPPA